MTDECNFDSRVNRDEDKTMGDKTMPTNIWATYVPEVEGYNGGHYTELDIDESKESFPKEWLEPKEYTLVHNNPEYHVIKKSDVDGDVMDMLRETVVYTDKVTMSIKTYEALRAAIIAQSDKEVKNENN